MIKNTFQILDRVGTRKEKIIWKQGIHDWNSFRSKETIEGISHQKKSFYDRQLKKAAAALHKGCSDYFCSQLPSNETWRLYDHFKEDSVFLDIEAEGVGRNADITVIGIFDGLDTKTMIKGINMDYHVLKSELSKYKLIITFNGSSFDIPFIKKRYDILPDVPAIDIRHCCSRIGLTGGLKNIEKNLGIGRNEIIEKFHGGDPLALWKMYKATGDDYYLKLLVEYNEDDCVNLKKIMNHCYERLCEGLRHDIE